LWDFFECNLDTLKNVRGLVVTVGWGSQFPLWDFFECNIRHVYATRLYATTNSQFPLWDFFECNLTGNWLSMGSYIFFSQFPLWDFFECNKPSGVTQPVFDVKENSQFPFWDFFECNLMVTHPKTSQSFSLNSLSGISLNATKNVLYIDTEGGFKALNSLSGISLNATIKDSKRFSKLKVIKTLNSLSGISLNAT